MHALTGWSLWWRTCSSREPSCDSRWTTSAPAASCRHSCRSSDSTPGRGPPGAWGWCTGGQWPHTPSNRLRRSGPRHKRTQRWFFWLPEIGLEKTQTNTVEQKWIFVGLLWLRSGEEPRHWSLAAPPDEKRTQTQRDTQKAASTLSCYSLRALWWGADVFYNSRYLSPVHPTGIKGILVFLLTSLMSSSFMLSIIFKNSSVKKSREIERQISSETL